MPASTVSVRGSLEDCPPISYFSNCCDKTWAKRLKGRKVPLSQQCEPVPDDFISLAQPAVIQEESLVRLACGHESETLSGLLTDERRPSPLWAASFLGSDPELCKKATEA